VHVDAAVGRRGGIEDDDAERASQEYPELAMYLKLVRKPPPAMVTEAEPDPDPGPDSLLEAELDGSAGTCPRCPSVLDPPPPPSRSTPARPPPSTDPPQ